MKEREGELVRVKPNEDANNPWDKNAGEEFVVKLYSWKGTRRSAIVEKVEENEWPEIPPDTTQGPRLYCYKSIIFPLGCGEHGDTMLYNESTERWFCPFCKK